MKKGFTLVELSIALVIIGLLIGGSVQMMSMLSKRAKVTEAKQQLDTLKESIIGYVQANGHLPTKAVFATEMGDVIDPWGKPIDYYNIDNTTNMLCDYSTSFNITESPAVTNVAFALVSGGANHNMQTDLADEKKLYTMGTDNIDENGSDFTRPEEYDDLFVVMNLNELQSMVDCQTNKFKIINTTLPVGTAGTAYNLGTTIVTTGGTPTCSSPPVSPCVFSVSGLPTGLNYSASTNAITGTPATANNYPLTFTATNGKTTDTKSILLVISDPITVDSSGGGSGGGGTSAYDQCVAYCTEHHSNPIALAFCIARCP